MLEELPETLDGTYERTLREINKTNREHAHRLLQCLAVAVRPLRIAELAEVLTIDFEAASSGETSKLKTDWRWEDQEQAVLSTCSSLIAVVDKDGFQVVQFSHFSVKEFLTSPRLVTSSADVSRFHILPEPAHMILAKACLGTLLRLDDRSSWCNVADEFPLARYAAEYLVKHAQINDVLPIIREEMEILFDPDKPYFSAWIRLYDIDVKPTIVTSTLWYFAPSEKSDASPLYYVALCGFHHLAEYLIDKCPQQVNAIGGFYVSPLAAALVMGHFEIAQLLYQHGADVDVQGHRKRTLMYGASCTERLEVVQWLLRHGADPNALDSKDNWTPLHEAAALGEFEVAQTLLQHNADTNIQNRNGEIPLHLASQYGRSIVVRLLLEQGSDANARRKDGSTPLHLASRHGMLEVACLLIEHGADIGAEDIQGKDPIQVSRSSNMTKLLSDHDS